MLSKIAIFLLFIFTGVFLLSCKNTVPNTQKQHTIWKNEFVGNVKVRTDELESIIPFSLKENSKPFGLPVTPRVFWYKVGLDNFNKQKQELKLATLKQELRIESEKETQSYRKIDKYEKKINRVSENLETGLSWFWRNIGEKKTEVSVSKIEETQGKLKKFLFDIGYRDANVNFKLDTLNNSAKIKVTYQIDENSVYVIDSLQYIVDDYKIDSILEANSIKSLIKKGNFFDLRLVEAEKIRIDQLLKNSGYYEFSPKYILHGATNAEGSEAKFKEKKSGILRFEILSPENQEYHQQYEISEVLFKTFDPNSKKNIIKPDTVVFDEVTYVRLDRGIPLGVVSSRVLTKPNSIYNLSEIVETQRQIGMFNQFAFASSQLKSLPNNKLSLEYFAPLLEKYTFGVSPGINNIYNDGSTFFGFGVPVTLTARNRFQKLEIIQASLRASYEGQPSPINNDLQPIRGSLELGLNVNVTFPNIYPLNKAFAGFNLKNPRTIVGLGYNYSEPFWGRRLNFRMSTNYSIQLNKNATVFLSLLDANLINTIYSNNESGRSFYNTLVTLQNEGNNLKVTFDPQFVSSFNANFVFNNQNPAKLFSNSKFFRLFLESGGTTLNFLDNPNKINLVEKLFPLKETLNDEDSVRAYFRFLKINADFRRTINIDNRSSYAYKLNLGLINPYGSNKSVPYDKNFFIGGSNSIRAWAPRSLGPGSSPSDTTASGNTIPQPGDILLEMSLEYRKTVFHLAGDIQFAAFLDAGNIWKWHNINTPTKNEKANFDARRFLKEIAVGTGIGLRWDLSYFLFRFDWGIKVVDPSRSSGDRYVLDEFSLRRNSRYGLNWNFGIGYPF